MFVLTFATNLPTAHATADGYIRKDLLVIGRTDSAIVFLKADQIALENLDNRFDLMELSLKDGKYRLVASQETITDVSLSNDYKEKRIVKSTGAVSLANYLSRDDFQTIPRHGNRAWIWGSETYRWFADERGLRMECPSLSVDAQIDTPPRPMGHKLDKEEKLLVDDWYELPEGTFLIYRTTGMTGFSHGDYRAALWAWLPAEKTRHASGVLANKIGLKLHKERKQYREAIPYFRAAADNGITIARYNLACGLARIGATADAIKELREYRSADPEGFQKRIGTDPDLESLRDLPAFKALTP